MEHILENKFLNKEGAQREAFNEADETLEKVYEFSLMTVEEAQF